MSIGAEIKRARKMKGLTQGAVAERVFVDPTLLTRIEKGKRPASKGLVSGVTRELDDPQLYFAAMHEITGGACPPWLNNVELHPAAVAMKVLEEVEEAVAAIRAATKPLSKRPDQLTPEERKMLDVLMEEVREKVNAGMMLIGTMCMTYGYSWAGQWQDHIREVKAKNYLT